MPKTDSILPVVRGRVCCGCGACAVICPHHAITIHEAPRYNFAHLDPSLCTNCGACLSVCPSEWLLNSRPWPEPRESEPPTFWTAYSSDPSQRREGASGGFITALAADLLSRHTLRGAVMIRPDDSRPFFNLPTVARASSDVARCRGSRYAPSSACLGLSEALTRDGKYMFVGKGCDIAALRRLQFLSKTLSERVVLAIGLFCSQTPARTKTTALLKAIGIDPSVVSRIDYRGEGWPGAFRAIGSERILKEIPYAQAWRRLSQGLPALRCFLCPDGMAASADVSVGDPWGLGPKLTGRDGLSFVIARTKLGKHAAAEGVLSGAVVLENAPDDWVHMRLAQQARRRSEAASRLLTYSAVFSFRRIAAALFKNGPLYARTIVAHRLSPRYY